MCWQMSVVISIAKFGDFDENLVLFQYLMKSFSLEPARLGS